MALNILFCLNLETVVQLSTTYIDEVFDDLGNNDDYMRAATTVVYSIVVYS